MYQKIKILKLKYLQMLFCMLFFLTFLLIGQKSVFAKSPDHGLFSGVNKTEQITVTGTVTDVYGQAMLGVTVVVKGTVIGTVTNADGFFQLSIPADAQTLIFSFIGMKTQEVEIEGRKVFDIVMEQETLGIDELVVIGYGTQSRATMTSSVTKVDSKVLETIPYANLGAALQGSAPGVLVQNTTGQPGAAPRIIIRGGTSINNPNGAAPLYVVDGVIRPDMNHINSADIESIQVLKDASSTSIYGARASNGVVLITTKSGKSGKFEVNYNHSLTFSKVGKTYDMASAHDYIYYGRLGILANEKRYPGSMEGSMSYTGGYRTGNDLTKNTAYTTQYLTPENEHKLNEGWKSMPDPLDPSKTIIYAETDWQDVLFNTAISNNHNFSFSGGTDKVTMNAGFGYLDNDGVAQRTGYKRFSGQINTEVKLRENLKMFANVMYGNSSDQEVYSESDIFFHAAGLAPTAKYKFEDGTLSPGRLRSSGNPEYQLNVNKSDRNVESMTLTGGARWDILPGLSFKPQLSYYKNANDNYSFTPSYLNGINNWNLTRDASSGYSKYTSTQADAVFFYKKTFSKHNMDVTAGMSYYAKERFSLFASGNGAATDIIPTLNAISEMTAMSSSKSEQVVIGYFGRVNYDFEKRYLASLSLRYDGASNLGTKNKWGYFPGVAIGWNIHEENFWGISPNIISRLKLRGSYGTTGNIGGLGDYQAQGSYSVGNRYMGASAIQNTVLPNNDLKWETSKTLNFGTDISFLNQRINFLFDAYRRVTEDLITNLLLPPSTGFSNIQTNFGSLENKGIEIELAAQIIKPTKESGFEWYVAFNAASTKHKILQLPENDQENNRVGGRYLWDPSIQDYAWLGGLQEGGTIGDFYSWKSLGVYATDEEAANAPTDLIMSFADKTKYGGDTNFLDADENGVIDSKDMVYMGSPFPKWTGGFSSTLRYKGFELYARADYMTGHTIYNYAKIYLAGEWASNHNMPNDMIVNGWHEQGDIARFPQFRPATSNYSLWRGANYYQTSSNSEFYESGNFLCIREVTLGYNLPTSILRKINVNNMRFTVSGNNLHYFTKYSGMNPEDGGTDEGRYPLPKSLILGITVTL